MSTLTIHPADQNQETAIRLFLDALHVEYKTNDESSIDETAYLMSSPAMVEHLSKAKDQESKGEGVNISLDDIWE